VAVLIAGVVYVGADDAVHRHHQHLERPSELDLGTCEVCDDTVLCTHLPIIVIDTFGQEIPGRPLAFGTGIYNNPETLENFHTTPDGEDEIKVMVSVIDNLNAWNHTTDTPVHESLAMMRLRGNSSRLFDKASYRISLIDEDGLNRFLPLLGMESHFEWALHGPFLDRTMMRNYMWMNIAAEVMGPGHFVPNVRFFELIIDGEFQGLYVLMETIRIGTERLPMNNHREGMISTSYLLRLDSNARSPHRHVNVFSTYTHRLEARRNVEILYPRARSQTPEMHEYIARSLSSIEYFIYSPDILWSEGMYRNYINVDSFINFYIINEFVANNDLWSNSTYLHKDIRGRLIAGPVWDFNNVMDNFFRPMPYDRFILADRGWFDRLMMCPDFTDAVIRRWHSLRENVLAEERLINYMDEVALWLGSAIDRNFEVWGYSFDVDQLSITAMRRPTYLQALEGVTRYDLNPSSFEEAMEWSRDFMVSRGRFLDEYIEALRQFSHGSRHALWIIP